MGAFEVTPMATVREVFETNTFGVMAMTQAVLPQFRARKSGVIVNVTTSAALAPMPLVAVYTASKTAIEGFTASLAFELEAFQVRVKLAERIFASLRQLTAVTKESDVAEGVWRAANDSTGKLRFPAGPDAVALAQAT
ncbi:SDR family NAD(P)-dependent oxidoreductase [Vitiosangium sp. GDMCC 1.1324]|uniref:SDR family NAD(P)-dependent oxidoreductase n=1 Tax=Vitiosangium sp. (strain GDMCC 1.1324) TaxID=2138576 RepID=UPI0021014C5F|nr:SDR family NAD(P)-dependent oxidoreductase [Vitiosangium sp. GDMCC 1.1324]